MTRPSRSARLACCVCGGPDTVDRPCVAYADGWAHGDRCYARALQIGLELMHVSYGDRPPLPEPVVAAPAAPVPIPPPVAAPFWDLTAIERLLIAEERRLRTREVERRSGV